MQFKNESFVVDLEEESGCRLSLRVKALPNAVQKAHKQAIKRINKEISIPGFRKGKAPDETVLKNYGNYVEKEWKELLVDEALRTAILLTKKYPLNKNSVEKPSINSCSLEEGAEIQLNYECYPEIPSIDFSKIQKPSLETTPVSEEEVHARLLEIQERHAEWEDYPAEKKIEPDDYVELTIESLDKEPPTTYVNKGRFGMKDKDMPKWLQKILLGQEVGSVEGFSEVNETASVETQAQFVPTKVRITIHSIKKILPPELNDAFAEKAGSPSLEALMQKIRDELQKIAENTLKTEQQQFLQKALLDSYPLVLPASLLTKEKQARLKEKLKEEAPGTAPPQELLDKVHEESSTALRLHFLYQQLVEQGGLSVSTEEVNQELIRLIYQHRLHEKSFQPEDIKRLTGIVSNELLNQKTKDYLLAQVLAA